jgi:hypothetical protein
LLMTTHSTSWASRNGAPFDRLDVPCRFLRSMGSASVKGLRA